VVVALAAALASPPHGSPVADGLVPAGPRRPSPIEEELSRLAAATSAAAAAYAAMATRR
jgi:hypothetical protein